eukprot:2619082-Rhodomonas_salina.1
MARKLQLGDSIAAIAGLAARGRQACFAEHEVRQSHTHPPWRGEAEHDTQFQLPVYREDIWKSNTRGLAPANVGLKAYLISAETSLLGPLAISGSGQADGVLCYHALCIRNSASRVPRLRCTVIAVGLAAAPGWLGCLPKHYDGYQNRDVLILTRLCRASKRTKSIQP